MNSSSPAFPSLHSINLNASGLTKREWMAGQVAAGIMATVHDIDTRKSMQKEPDGGAKKMAQAIVFVADAILKELEKP